MKFTATSDFTAIANAASKIITPAISFKLTTSISDALTSGTWVDATSYIHSVDDPHLQIELDFAQFSADSININGRNIAWWDANVLNYSSTQQVECKYILTFGYSPTALATDVVYIFSGFIDKSTIAYDNNSDSVSFSVTSLDALADKSKAELLVTQYVDGTSGGIAFHDIPGVYITSTAIASYLVLSGVHTLSYSVTGGIYQASFDGGQQVNINAPGGGTTFTLGNGYTNADDTQRINITIEPAVLISTNDTNVTEDFVALTTGAALPYNWYRGISVQALAKKILSTMGTVSQTLGTEEINSWDSGYRYSFLDYTVDGVAVANIGISRAIAYKNSTTTYIGNGKKVYTYNPVTSTVTLLTTVASGTVLKLMYNARNDHLFIYYGTGGTSDSIVRYTFGTSTLETPVVLTNCHDRNLELFDFLATIPGTYEYSIIYVNSLSNSIDRFDCSAMTKATLFTAADFTLSPGPIDAIAVQRSAAGVNYFRFFATDSTLTKIQEIQWIIATDSVWHVGSLINTHCPVDNLGGEVQIQVGAYIAGEDTYYYWEDDSFRVRKFLATSGTATNLLTLTTTGQVNAMYSDGTYVYFSTLTGRSSYLVNSSGLTTLALALRTQGNCMIAGGGRIWGVDYYGRLFQVSSTVSLFCDKCIFAGMSVRGALSSILTENNCVATISPNKAAILYPRANNAGTPQTSGSRISLTVTNAENLQKNNSRMRKFDWIELIGATSSLDFDGTTYSTVPTSIDKRVLTISGAGIHATVLKDYLTAFWNFFSVNRVLWKIPVLASLFQYEPMDGCDLTFTTTKITSNTTNNVIYGVTYHPIGTMEVEVLI